MLPEEQSLSGTRDISTPSASVIANDADPKVSHTIPAVATDDAFNGVTDDAGPTTAARKQCSPSANSSADGIHKTNSSTKSAINIDASSPEKLGKRSHIPPEAEVEEPASKKCKQDILIPAPTITLENATTPCQRFPSPPDEQVTEYDTETWSGWCEIESDPEYFSVMVKDMGANGVCVREAIAMAADDFMALPQPIYGIILLLRYREIDTKNQEDECPKDVWFANQMPGQNSCATLAMTNILMNVSDVDLGENLQQFKEFTADLKPPMRGATLAGFDFVRNIHNSFATKMDMLLNDKNLAHKASKGRHGVRRPSQDSKATNDTTDSVEDNAHHYIAFVPINGKVWKLDGLDTQPTCIGECDEANPNHWKEIVCHRIHMLMQSAQDTEYNMLVLAQAPLTKFRKDLCANIATKRLVESRLDAMNTDWKSMGKDTPETPITPGFLEPLGVSPSIVDATQLPDSLRSKVVSEQTPELLARRGALLREQISLPESIMMAADEEARENQKAEARRWDYEPLVRKWMEMLAENGYLERNLDRFKKQK